MKKKFTLFVVVGLWAITGLCPAVQAQDYTSHIANADLEEGGDPDALLVTGNRMGFYGIKNWKTEFHSTNAASNLWDVQHFTFSAYSAANPSISGYTGGEDNFTTPAYEPTSGEGYYQHAVSNGSGLTDGRPTFLMEQVINTLPAGEYRLEADGVLLVLDETGNDAANGFDWYLQSTGAFTKKASFPHFLNEQRTGSSATIGTPGLSTISVDFAVMEDNEPITIGAYFKYPAWREIVIYVDNFRLTRTGDVSTASVVAGINGQTEMEYAPLLIAKFDELGADNGPVNWEDSVWYYTDPVPAEINTVATALAHQRAVIDWTNRIDTLISVRAELTALIDSTETLLLLGYAGTEALAEASELMEALLQEAPGIAAVQEGIAELEQAILEYRLSGLADATYDDPVDMTFYITNPTIDGPTGPMTADVAHGWTIEARGTTQPYLHTGNNNEDGTPNTTTYFNTWSGTVGEAKYLATQTLTGLPTGVYRLGARVSASGTGVYLFGQSSGTYFATEGETGSVFKPCAVENIVVLDGTLTIGVTSKGDELFMGNPFGGTWFSCDDFTLEYCGSDIGVIVDILAQSIADAEVLLNESEGIILGGDLAEIQSLIVAARAAVAAEPLDQGAVALSLGAMNGVGAKINTSVAAYNSVVDKMDEAQIVADKPLVSAEAKGELLMQVAIAGIWLEDGTSVAADAVTLVAELDAQMAAAEKSQLEGVSPGSPVDATFLIVNPDQAQSTTGYTFDRTNTNYIGVASDFFATPTNHLYYWQGSIVPDATFNIHQTITQIPDGYYRLTVNAVYGANEAGDEASDYPNGNVVLYAFGDIHQEKQTPLSNASVLAGDTIGGINKYDNRPSLYTVDSVQVSHGFLTFGIKSIGYISTRTVRAYGFTLTFLEKGESLPYPDAIGEIGAEEIKVYAENGYIVVEGDAPYTITTISGARVAPYTKLAAGIYIVRSGAKTVKIVVD